MNEEYEEIRFSETAQSIMDRLRELAPHAYEMLDALEQEGIDTSDLRKRFTDISNRFGLIYNEYRRV